MTRIRVKTKLPESYAGTSQPNPNLISQSGNLGVCLKESGTMQRIFCIDGLSAITGSNASKTTVGSITANTNSKDLNVVSAYIGNTVKNISYVFDGSTSLKNVIFQEPSQLTSIGTWAFRQCSGLSSITIPGSVTIISAGSFEECTRLLSVTIPDSVTSIGNNVFRDCSGLTTITIPDSVTSIGNGAFYGCSGLTSVTIPDGVTNIKYSAFSGCSGLSSITIPDSVTSIEGDAFAFCNSLSVLNLNTAQRYVDIDGHSSNEYPGSTYFFSEFAIEKLQDQYDPDLSGYNVPSTNYINNITSFFGGDYKIYVPTALYKSWTENWNTVSSHIVPYGTYVPEEEEEITFSLDPSKTYLITNPGTAAIAVNASVISGETATMSVYNFISADEEIEP